MDLALLAPYALAVATPVAQFLMSLAGDIAKDQAKEAATPSPPLMSAPAVATTARTPDVLALPFGDHHAVRPAGCGDAGRGPVRRGHRLRRGRGADVPDGRALMRRERDVPGADRAPLRPLCARRGRRRRDWGALVVVLAAPAVIIRRRRLRDPGVVGAAAVARLTAFCADAGIRRPPRLLAGSAALRDAFCLGRPGRYAVAIPLPLLIRPHTPLFEAALRHELAHVRGHDVAVSWLARAVWYALAPLLLLPVVLFSLTGNLRCCPATSGAQR